MGKIIKFSDFVRDFKRDSSKWIKVEEPRLAEFHWQEGYGAFSVSPSHVEPLMSYIHKQVEHHRPTSFQDEFRRLCQYCSALILRHPSPPYASRYNWAA